METILNNKYHREYIDLDEITRSLLLHQAASHGMDLKSYIESTLIHLSEEEEDRILGELASGDCGGILKGKEKEDFEKYLESLRCM